MQSLAHHALLGSVIAAAAGALVLTVATINHGISRRASADDENPEESARRLRVARLADTVAVFCFAVSAGLGLIGFLYQTQATAPSGVASGSATTIGPDGDRLVERVSELETRVAAAESEVQALRSAAAELRASDDRLKQLETRLPIVEDRAASAERRASAAEQLARERREERRLVAPATPPRRAPAAATATPAAATKPAPPGPSASPGLGPNAVEVATPPDPPAPRSASAPSSTSTIALPEPGRPPAVAKPEIVAPSPVVRTPPKPAPAPDVARSRHEPAREDMSIADRIRHDWEVVKREAQRGGEDWREGWRQLKRLFTD